jgi:hypothetical protein
MGRIQNVSRRGFFQDILSAAAFILGAHITSRTV